jgi:gamma-glutamyltranspeptidase/glutathione hydrolase
MTMMGMKVGMVCAAHPDAAAAGVEMLRLGGGGFMTLYMPHADTPGNHVVFLDFRECAPRAATPKRYYGTGKTLEELTVSGPLAVAVPGLPMGLAHAAAHYGKLSRDDLTPMLKPAIRYAGEGFEITPKMAGHLAAYYELLASFPDTARIFTTADGPILAGTRLRQPDLARTLVHIQEAGLRTFADGTLAERLAQVMAASGGLVTRDDLSQYQPRERQVMQGSYRGYTLWTAPPPSAGGIRLLQVLNIMEHYPLHAWGPNSVESIHLMAEALKPSYAAGERYIADPAAAPAIPLDELLHPTWAEARCRELCFERAAMPTDGDAACDHDRGCTTHYSIVDPWGNIVSATQTIGLFWGSGLVAADTGLLLNGEMNDFSEGQWHINAVAPGKIPRSNMCPTIVCKDDNPFLVLGSPGSERIPSAVLQTLSNIIDHGMDVVSAVAAPRMHWQDGTLHLEGGIAPAVAEALQRKGHRIKTYAEKDRYFGGVHAIRIDPETGTLSGAADPRRDGQDISL